MQRLARIAAAGWLHALCIVLGITILRALTGDPSFPWMAFVGMAGAGAPNAADRIFELVLFRGETYEDVAETLEDVAREVGHGQEQGNIVDADGETVGHWRFHE